MIANSIFITTKDDGNGTNHTEFGIDPSVKGAAAGLAAGATVGGIFGPVGSVTGAVIGGVLGAVFGPGDSNEY